MSLVKIGFFGARCDCAHIIKKYVCEYDSEKSSTAPMTYEKALEINNEDILVKLFYPLEQESSMYFGKQSYEFLDGIIFVYNVYKRHTFDSIKFKIENLSGNSDLSTINIIIVSHQMKEEEEEKKECVSKEEGEELARKLGCKLYEVNAQNGMNINDSINDLVNRIIMPKIEKKKESLSLKKTIHPHHHKKKCIIF